MSTNGQLVFTDVDKITFKGVGNASNAVIDTLTGKIGVGVDSPEANLHVLGNSYVSTNLELGGTLIMGTVNVEAQHSLEAVTATGNITPLTIEFTNPTTSLVASGNVVVTGNVTADHFVGDGSNITGISSTLQAITDSGPGANVTSNTVQFSNAITGFVTTANVEVGGELTVSGNVVVDTNTLFVDSVNNRVGIGTTTPGRFLEVYTGNGTVPGIRLRRGAGSAYTDLHHVGVNVPSSGDLEGLAIITSDGNATTQEVMRICGNGRVGIGTTSPSTDLQIGNTTDKTSDTYLTIASDGGSAYAQGIKLIHHHSNYGWRIRGDDTDDCFHINYISAGNQQRDAFTLDGGGMLILNQGNRPGENGTNRGMKWTNTDNNNYWNLFNSNNDHFRFTFNGANKGWVDPTHSGPSEMNDFTGQHRTFIKDVPFTHAEQMKGLIVSSDQNKYVRLNSSLEIGLNAISINESIPNVSLSKIANDKKCFGVISGSEDPETRTEKYGVFGSTFEKEKGDTRVYINSVGEGAIWVTNINGPLESGDYITTSTVKGYGQKQDDDILHNYTVAKITMDCNFDPVTQSVQMIKKDEDEENILDEHDQIQWEDHPTETEKAYKIRHLDANGVETDEASAVHKAAFVGCTYHCG